MSDELDSADLDEIPPEILKQLPPFWRAVYEALREDEDD